MALRSTPDAEGASAACKAAVARAAVSKQRSVYMIPIVRPADRGAAADQGVWYRSTKRCLTGKKLRCDNGTHLQKRTGARGGVAIQFSHLQVTRGKHGY